jgi:hypothetical protein
MTKQEIREAIKEELRQYPSVLSIKPKDRRKFNLHMRNRLDTVEEYTNLLMEVIRWESNFNHRKTYRENFINSQREYVISTGLFQLSTESLRGYGFNYTTQQLKDPRRNIKAGVKVFMTLVSQDKVIARKRWWFFGRWRGAARYWSVLRGERKYTARALTAIKRANK